MTKRNTKNKQTYHPQINCNFLVVDPLSWGHFLFILLFSSSSFLLLQNAQQSQKSEIAVQDKGDIAEQKESWWERTGGWDRGSKSVAEKDNEVVKVTDEEKVK